MQQALGSPDDEWTVLAPKVQRVLDAQTQLTAVGNMNTRGGGYGGGGRGAGGVAPTGGVATIQSTLADLNAILQDPSQGDDAVKARMQAYRDAVKAAQTALKNAQIDLVNFVTLRQEAILINLGYLE